MERKCFIMFDVKNVLKVRFCLEEDLADVLRCTDVWNSVNLLCN